MHCERCGKPVPEGAAIWRVSVGYFSLYYPPAVQSWCAVCSAPTPPDFSNWFESEQQWRAREEAERWHPAHPCDYCGRPVVFGRSRRVPLHAVCGAACRYAVKLAEARADVRAVASKAAHALAAASCSPKSASTLCSARTHVGSGRIASAIKFLMTR